MPPMTRPPVLLFACALILGLVFVPENQAQQKTDPKTTARTLGKMSAAGKSQKDMAQYVFEHHGCNGCHTAGENGKLGFTEKGKQLASGFEGCIRSLTAMNLIAQVPRNQRSSEQKNTAQRFDEYGCTLCHQIVPGKMGLSELGKELTHLHLGCVEVEKTLANKR
jgi:cytochrome c551/c552